MSTFLDVQAVCGHCGRGGATRQCPCKGASFCNKACQKAAWSEHRLSCSAAKPTSGGFGLGDIVRIEGLQSATNQTMNGKLAEVCQVDAGGDQFGVITTIPMDNDVQSIKSARLKPQNLNLHLSVHEAAKRAANNLLKDERSQDEKQSRQNKYILECIRVGCTIPSLSGEEIVRRIGEERDEILMQALLLPPSTCALHGSPPIPEVSAEVCEDMLQAGLIDACLNPLKFPELIDESAADPSEHQTRGIPVAHYITLLCNCLNKGKFGVDSWSSWFGGGNEARLNKYRVETCQKLGPAIMLCANKKRRLRGQTEHWLGCLTPMIGLVGNCLLAQPTASQVLMQQLDPVVKAALIDQVVFALTVDPRLFLRQSTRVPESLLNQFPAHLKMSALPVLVECVDWQTLGRQAVEQNFEGLLVPRGAPYGLAGRTFVASWLDIAALCCLEELDSGIARRGGRQLLDELQYIIGQFWNIPSIRQQCGEFDEGLANCRSPGELRHWAEMTIMMLMQELGSQRSW